MSAPEAAPARGRALRLVVEILLGLAAVLLVGWFVKVRLLDGQLGGMRANRDYVARNQASIAATFSTLSFDPDFTGGLMIGGDWPGGRAQLEAELVAFFGRQPLPDHPWVHSKGLRLTVECDDDSLVGGFRVGEDGLEPIVQPTD